MDRKTKSDSMTKKYLFLFIFLPLYFLFCERTSKKLELELAEENLVYEKKSAYSHFKIRDYGSLRTLYFVRDNGDEVVESTMDINAPQNLFLLYTQVMFVSFLYVDKKEDLLLAGLGGGSMVQFINYHFPNIKLDVVEIDGEIIRSAREQFHLKENQNTRIIEKDIFAFLEEKGKKYDIIMMDAFLKPSINTDPTGISIKQKQKKFFQTLKDHLRQNGVVVFNLNSYGGYLQDIKMVQENFKQVRIYRKNRSGNIIVLGTDRETPWKPETLLQRGTEIDNKLKPNFSFAELVGMEKSIDYLEKLKHD
jgi:spermidine synthase